MEEIEDIVRQVYGSDAPASNTRVKEAILAMTTTGRTRSTKMRKVTREQFETFVIEHPVLLEPAVELQGKLRSEIIGTSFWEMLSVRRAGMADMRAVSDFVSQLKRDRAKSFTTTFSAGAPTDEHDDASRRAAAINRLREERAAHDQAFGKILVDTYDLPKRRVSQRSLRGKKAGKQSRRKIAPAP